MAQHRGDRAYLGIDVGTGSARAAVVDDTGLLLGAAAHPIEMWRPAADHVEQSSDDIWRAVCAAVRGAVAEAGIDTRRLRGVGFDATCSLVVLDADDRPVSVGSHGIDAQNVIVWMDHRALAEAERVNATGHAVLGYVGGKISPEMQSPKLLWLKRHLTGSWQRGARFFDLPDFLTYRATGDETRSLCSTVCKWTYLGHEQGAHPGSAGRWDETFFRAVGLGDLVDEGYARIGRTVRPIGARLDRGLCARAAQELGLPAGTAVSVSIIDAHAGGVGMLGAAAGSSAALTRDLDRCLALIGGTSSCHMAVSREPRFIPGVWGPYFSAMMPGWWLNEGGQSATGALIDHVIATSQHGAALRDGPAPATGAEGTIYERLNRRLAELARGMEFPAQLTREVHVLPYFHGNRSPRADGSLRGAICGLKLSDTADDLAVRYLATVQAIAHGTRHIIAALNQNGYRIDTIIACGGGTKNPLFLREHADVTGCRIMLPREPEAVLLGSAMLAAAAAGDFDSVPSAMAAMSGIGETIEPASGDIQRYHDAKHEVFLRMYEDFMAYRHIMESSRQPGSREPG